MIPGLEGRPVPSCPQSPVGETAWFTDPSPTARGEVASRSLVRARKVGMSDATEVVDAQLDAYNARDLGRFVACHAPGVVITNASGDVLAEGHDGMRQMYDGLFENGPRLALYV